MAPAAARSAFWQRYLAGAHSTRLPRYCMDVGGPGHAAEQVVPIPLELSNALHAGAGQLGVPVGSLLLAGHVAALGFVADVTDVMTGWTVSDGTQVVTLPFRLELDTARRWSDLVLDAHRAEATIKAHRRCATAHLSDVAVDGGIPIETVFEFEPNGAGNRDSQIPFRAAYSIGGTGDIRLSLVYHPDVFGSDQVERFGGYCLRALEQIAHHGSNRCRPAALLGAEEHVLRGFSGPDAPLPKGTFANLFDHHVRDSPDSLALTCGADRLTYAALDAESDRMVCYLRDRGVAPGDVVTTLLARGIPWAVTVLALMKLGAVYLPQDIDDPAERIVAVLESSRCRHLVTEAAAARHLHSTLLAAAPAVNVMSYEHSADAPIPSPPVPRPSAGDPAYIIFTSGSTGRPKGAVIRHSGLLNHLVAKQRDLRLASTDRIAQVATQCFDISVWQLLAAWMCGGSTRIYTRFDVLDVPGFLRCLATDEITVVEVVPSYLELMISEAAARPFELPGLRFTVVTGEPLRPDLTRRWLRQYPTVPLVNAYGPTEASDDVTHHHIQAPVGGTRVPVGRPIINTGIHVVGRDDALRPLGSYGEIRVTGAGVGSGYVNDDERTAVVFRPNTLDDRSDTAYHTGDIGRWLPGGLLDVAGRTDGQVKIRGHRIELSEVDEAVARLPGVDAAITVTRTVAGQTGQAGLVTYFVGSAAPALVEFQRGLAAILPAYMHPEKVVRLTALPLTPRGKIDRNALRQAN